MRPFRPWSSSPSCSKNRTLTALSRCCRQWSAQSSVFFEQLSVSDLEPRVQSKFADSLEQTNLVASEAQPQVHFVQDRLQAAVECAVGRSEIADVFAIDVADSFEFKEHIYNQSEFE